MVQQIQEALVADAKKAWQAFAPEVGDKSSIPFDVAVNNELLELIRRCRDRSADLLVLGIHGKTTQHGTGVLAAQAVRRAPCKVLLAREGHTGPYRRVLVGVDFSDTSRLALEAALRIVAQDGGTLSLVYILRPPWMRFQFRAPAPTASPEFRDQFLAALRQRLEAFAHEADPDITWAKPQYDIIESSSHGAGLVAHARSTGADLVVLGTRGRTNFREMLIGSTAERVVRDAPCSILAIKPRE
jgi:nucleotide-binding universal stress UspA family protein